MQSWILEGRGKIQDPKVEKKCNPMENFQWWGISMAASGKWREREMKGIRGQSLCTSLALIHEPWPMIMRPQNPNIHRYKWPKQTLPKICE
ncbi:hypothetical protein NC651_029546 [Populus alba x Populus x berolinensis]|nr:hypothetical protein NC651_029546 [Populus alba x Populus x berolinensis]